MEHEFFDIGSVKALLSDARERIKESEDRCNKKIEEVEKRIITILDVLAANFNTINNKIIEWLPLFTSLSKGEENKRNLYLILVVSLITNIASWIITLFIYFVKLGVVTK